MDNLIETINKLQTCSNKYGIMAIHYPEIVVIGAQSSGKSSILERIIECDILPKGPQVATRCPIILQLVTNPDFEELEAVFIEQKTRRYKGEEDIRERLQEITDNIRGNLQGVSETPIIIQLTGNRLPTLTLIDLPGMIKNEGELQVGSALKIQEITEKYVQSPYSIILAISPANVDPANSDAIQIARYFDPTGRRTVNVITKLDLMDQGTDGRDLLRSNFFQNSLATVFLVNRSQKGVSERTSLMTAKQYEKTYLQKFYSEIASDHGITCLINILVEKLRAEIKNNSPHILKEIDNRKNQLINEINKMSTPDDDSCLTYLIMKFIKNYKNRIHGHKTYDQNELKGGAKISKILYEDYLKAVESLGVESLSKENVTMVIQNATGNRKMSYSNENAFILLITQEIEKLRKPSEDALQDVMILLKQFIAESAEQTEIANYPMLLNWIEVEMLRLIERRYNCTQSIISDLISCEKNDVFCIHPNSQCFQHLKNPKQTKKNENFEDSINKAAIAADILLPPYIKLFLRTAQGCGAIKTLAGINSWKEFNFETVLGKNLNPEIESKKAEIVNFADRNVKFHQVLKILAKSEGKTEVVENWKESEVMIICDMVKDYFDMVQKNTIYNFPKWIQTFLIKELINEMTKHLVNIDENSKQFFLKMDEKLEERLSNCKEELRDLQEIEKDMHSCSI